MKYFLIIKRLNEHYQISTEDEREIWYKLDEETLKKIIEDWFCKTSQEDKHDN